MHNHNKFEYNQDRHQGGKDSTHSVRPKIVSMAAVVTKYSINNINWHLGLLGIEMYIGRGVYMPSHLEHNVRSYNNHNTLALDLLLYIYLFVCVANKVRDTMDCKPFISLLRSFRITDAAVQIPAW